MSLTKAFGLTTDFYVIRLNGDLALLINTEDVSFEGFFDPTRALDKLSPAHKMDILV